MTSVLGELALRLCPSPENLATEALAYVLRRSPAAERAFRRALDAFGPPAVGPLTFRTQAADAGAIPDLVGADAGGTVRVMVEAKFWAGLTERQPTEYLEKLPADGLLVFLAPSRRRHTLWPELRRRCEKRWPLGPTVELGPDTCVAHCDGKRIGLTSWRAVLDLLLADAVLAGEAEAAADLGQLRGLTDRMDTDRFLPFTGEELTAATGNRVRQLCDLVDQVCEWLVAQKAAVWGAGRSTGSRHGGYTSAPLDVRGTRCRLWFSAWWWAEFGHPLGLSLDPRQLPDGRVFQDVFRPFAARSTRRVEIDDQGVWVALDVKTGVELEDVVRDIGRQCRELFALLEPAAPPAGEP